MTAFRLDPGRRGADGRQASADCYEVKCVDERVLRRCRLEDLRPLRGSRWPKARERTTGARDPDLDRALALVGKRARVWYATARRWRVVTVRHVVLWRAKGVPAGPLLQVARAGRVNPWCYTLAEARPIEVRRGSR